MAAAKCYFDRAPGSCVNLFEAVMRRIDEGGRKDATAIEYSEPNS
jgi:hypothetical protein